MGPVEDAEGNGAVRCTICTELSSELIETTPGEVAAAGNAAVSVARFFRTCAGFATVKGLL